MSGDKPPWTQRIESSIICRLSHEPTLIRHLDQRLTAAKLRWSKTEQHAFQTDGLPYFCMHSSNIISKRLQDWTTKWYRTDRKSHRPV